MGNRLLHGLLIVVGAACLSFFLVNLTGDPSDVRGSGLSTPEQRAAMRHALGYDQPLLERFGHFVSHALRGDLGSSYRTGETATSAVLHALPYTMLLVLAAMLLACLVAVPLAVTSVLRRHTRTDSALVTTMMVVQGIPDFYLAVMLVMVFAVQAQLLPALGEQGLTSWILPTLAIAIPVVPTVMRMLRGELLDVMQMEFVTALRAKGVGERAIVLRHGLRNASAPMINVLALQLGWLLGGTLVVEVIFSWPGIGSLLFDAVKYRDLALVQAVVVLVALGYVLLNLAADLLVIAIDPRIRVGRA